MVVKVKYESERNSINCYFPSETFVVLTADH